MIDFSHIQIIDNHCHPYLKTRELDNFRSYWSTSLIEGASTSNSRTLTYHMMLNSLKNLIGLDESATEEMVIAKRNELYQKDPRGYTSKLMDDAGIEMIMADFGFPSVGFSGYSISPDEFSKSMPINVKPIIRIDNIMLDLIKKNLSFQELIDLFDKILERDISTQQPIALKTAVAYLAGLKIKRYTHKEIEASYEKIQANPENMVDAFPLFFYAVFMAIDKCNKYHLPLQIHTGFGNAPFLDIASSNPTLLFDFLNDSEVRKIEIVLLHTGCPYVREMTYLINNYPNLWVDISQATQYTSVGLEGILNELLSMAPINKIMYGSDGLGLPELFWWPAVQARKTYQICSINLSNNSLLGLNMPMKLVRYT